jgi:DNA-binding XRE family transcriptional regulator
MITAEALKQLTTIKKDALVALLEKGDSTPSWAYAIKKCHFVGMTNHGQFCYGLEYDQRIAQRAYQSRRPDKVFISRTLVGSLVVGT